MEERLARIEAALRAVGEFALAEGSWGSGRDDRREALRAALDALGREHLPADDGSARPTTAPGGAMPDRPGVPGQSSDGVPPETPAKIFAAHSTSAQEPVQTEPSELPRR